MDDIPDKRCEKCQHYNMWDSGYGECRRFPPCIRQKVKNGFCKYHYEDQYPIVAWCNFACAEYSPKKRSYVALYAQNIA